MRRRCLLVLGLLAPLAAGSTAAAATREVKEAVLGRADAPVAVIEYFSLTCPHCASFHRDAFPKIREAYIDTGKVKWVLRDFPLDRYALMAAVIAHCAGPERYPAFVDTLLGTQQQWARSADPLAALKTIGRLGGLTDEQMDACLSDPEMVDAVLRMRLEGEQQHGVDSTPSFIVGGRRHSGAIPFDEFRKILDPLL